MGSTKLTELNIIANANPDIVRFLKNKEDAYKYSYGSTKLVDVVCVNCGFEKQMKPNTLYYQGFGCPVCDDNISTPNKFMFNVLTQIGIDFIPEKQFQWSKNRKYDFYIPSLNMIIEMHGKQHYKEWNLGKPLKEEQENDCLKKNLAIENGINEYIIINCTDTRLNKIKDKTIEALETFINFDIVKWDDVIINCTKSYVLIVSDLYNKNYSISEMSDELKLSECAISRLLKVGKEYNFNSYSQFYSSRHQVLKINISNGDIIDEYASISEASRLNGVSLGKISDACKGKCEHIFKGFIWKFKDEKSHKRLENKIKNSTRVFKKVLQFTLDGIFIKEWNSIREICTSNDSYKKESIASNCNGVNKTAYGFIWKYKPGQ